MGKKSKKAKNKRSACASAYQQSAEQVQSAGMTEPPLLPYGILVTQSEMEALRSAAKELHHPNALSKTHVLQEAMEQGIQSNQTIKKFTLSNSGVSIEMSLRPLSEIRDNLTLSPYQVERIVIDPELLKRSHEELEQLILSVFRKACTDGFIRWLSYQEQWNLAWLKIWCAELGIPAGEELDNPEAVEKMAATHEKVLYENFDQVWLKGLSRFVREHPQLLFQQANRNRKTFGTTLRQFLQLCKGAD